MILKRAMFAVLVLVAAASRGWAFEGCASLSQPDELTRLADEMVRRSPSKYDQVSRGIKVITAAPADSIMPFASEQQGVKFVVLPSVFPRIACQIALAEFLVIGGAQPAAMDEAAKAAAQCLDRGALRKACLSAFADDLGLRYRAVWASRSAEERKVAFGIAQGTLRQILVHEYGHHLLDHVGRIRSQKITRIDAEFEADLYAMMNAVQAGEATSAMYYFFEPLENIEQYTKTSTTPDYESGACRARNVDNIAGTVGIIPIALVDAAYGGGFTLSRNSAASVRRFAQEHFAKQTQSSPSCARMATVALGSINAELKQLYDRMNPDLDLLFSAEKQVDVARVRRLLRDLSAFATRAQYTDAVAVKSIALILRRWGLRGRPLAPLTVEVEALTADAGPGDGFLNEDFGRLLQSKGLALLQEPTELTATARMRLARDVFERAVHYDDQQSEAWMNLAIIALKNGDCGSAAKFSARSLQTLTDDSSRESTQFFVTKMNELSRSPEGCRTAGANYHPYPGL